MSDLTKRLAEAARAVVDWKTGSSIEALREVLSEYDAQAQPSCRVCGGAKTVEQFTSAAAPIQRVKCFACNGTGKRLFSCFSDKNPEADWIEAEHRESAASKGGGNAA